MIGDLRIADSATALAHCTKRGATVCEDSNSISSVGSSILISTDHARIAMYNFK